MKRAHGGFSIPRLFLTLATVGLLAAACSSGSSSDTTTTAAESQASPNSDSGAGNSSEPVSPPQGSTLQPTDGAFEGFKLYTTSQSVQQVDDYYKKAFEKAGWTGGSSDSDGELGGASYTDGKGNYAMMQAEKTDNGATFYVCFASQDDLSQCGKDFMKFYPDQDAS